MKKSGVQIRITEPWLAMMSNGESKVIEIPTGEIRELKPYNFMSKNSVSIDIRESGSMSRFGISSDASGASDALKSTLAQAASIRGFGMEDEKDEIILTLTRLNDVNIDGVLLPKQIVFWKSGKIERKN